MTDALFERQPGGDGELGVYVPSELAHGPWMVGTLHGGPVCGLVAHAAEQFRPDASFIPARAVVDMHRPVPMAPITVRARLERQSRRMALVSVELIANEKEVTRGSVLFARSSDAPKHRAEGHAHVMSRGPADIETTAIVPKGVAMDFPPGFHREAEVRWVEAPGTAAPVGWMRMPMALIAGETPTPFERIATISDLGNAVASVTKRRGDATPAAYINPDTTIYLEREARGEWIGLALDSLSESQGVGLSEVALFDEQGCVGRMLSTRIHNPITR
jgi:acyl-CoA thioesterase